MRSQRANEEWEVDSCVKIDFAERLNEAGSSIRKTTILHLLIVRP